MNKNNPPTTFGVFKPVGHTVIALHTGEQCQQAVAALTALGFPESEMVRYTPAEMAAQVDAELLAAGPVSTAGYELALAKSRGDLAKNGCSFLVVKAETDDLAAKVAQWVRTAKPASAQHYGTFMIEDLTEAPPGRVVA